LENSSIWQSSSNEPLKVKHPEACVLVHPESPQAVVDLADVVGSTSSLINAVQNREETTFIVATDNGIFHKMHAVAQVFDHFECTTRSNHPIRTRFNRSRSVGIHHHFSIGMLITKFGKFYFGKVLAWCMKDLKRMLW
jgi:hypothetical protein